MSARHTKAEILELEALMKDEFFTPVPPENADNRTVTSKSHAHYQYRPLSERGVVRLFRLNQGTNQDTLRGSIVHVPIKKLQPYEALSYAWGSENKPCYIELATTRLLITESLYTALLRLRRHDKARLLWVDAICIDQSNNAEKSQQIILMPLLYSRANCVLVWLGEDTGSGKNAIALLKQIGQTDFSSSTVSTITNAWMKARNLPEQGDDLWYDLHGFYSRSWFRRAWVVQEFVNAKDVIILCGDEEVHWKDLVGGMDKMSTYAFLTWGESLNYRPYTEKNESHAGLTSFARMLDLKHNSSKGSAYANFVRSYSEKDASRINELDIGYQSLSEPPIRSLIEALRHRPERIASTVDLLEMGIDGMQKRNGDSVLRLPLLTLLTGWPDAESTNPNDKLFAFLGLSEDCNNPAFRPNYDDSEVSVLMKYGRAFVENGQGVKMMYQAGTVMKINKMPSWIPEWTRTRQAETRALAVCGLTTFSYAAATDMLSNAQVTKVEDEIIVSGSFLDTITRKLTWPYPRPGVDGEIIFDAKDDILSRLRTYFKELDNLACGRESYHNGQSMYEAQWRTLTANLDSRLYPATKEWGMQYTHSRDSIDEFDEQKGFTLTQVLGVQVPYFARFLLLGRMNDFCETENGLFGLVPTESHLGDRIFLPAGSRMPYVLRSCSQNESKYQMIAVCYLHGIMNGEDLRSQYWRDEDVCLR